MSDGAEALAQARGLLGRVKSSLLAPNAKSLEQALPLLDDAAAHLKNLGAEAHGDLWPAQVEELRQELILARRMAEQAGAHFLGLAAVAQSASGTYSHQGEHVPPSGGHRLRVDG